MLVLGIDPGHGGEDSGCVHQLGIPEAKIVEAEYNLGLARALFARANRTGIRSFMTRTTDLEGVSLLERGKRTNKGQADLVISLHVNAHASAPDLKGPLCFHWPGNDLGKQVGNQILRAWPEPLHTPNRKSIAVDTDDGTWLQRPKNVLKYHKATTVLVEVGYATNLEDANALGSWAVQRGMLAALMSGIHRYEELKGI